MVWSRVVFAWLCATFLLHGEAVELNVTEIEDSEIVEYNVTETHASNVTGIEIFTESDLTDEGLITDDITEEPVHLRWVSQALGEAMVDYAPTSNKNTLCNQHSKLYLENLSNLTLWAVQMLDASAQSISGAVGAGRAHALGNYDQCLDVKEHVHGVKSQYCLAAIKYAPTKDAYPGYYTEIEDAYREPAGDQSVWEKIKVTRDERIIRRDIIYWALCVPSTCSAEDVATSLNTKIVSTFQKYNMTGGVSLEKKACQQSEGSPMPAWTVFAWIVIVIMAFTPVLSTIYENSFVDQKNPHREGILVKLILAFSLKTNMNDLIKESSNREFDIINGIKVISITIILGGHRLLYSLGNALINGQRWEQESLNFTHMIFYNSPYLVDTFFVFGGYLTFVGIYKQVEKTKRLNLHNLILMRWLRIVPAFLVIMVFYSLLMPTFSEGPLWPFRPELESRRCREHWWLNILFINNYVHADDQCHILSWYLACDMHLFILSCVLVYLLWKSPRLGEALCGILLIASCVIPFIVVYNRRYRGTFRMFIGTLWDPYKDAFFSTVYVKTHNRASPYIVGVIGAYVCSKLNAANYKFSKVSLVVGTIFFVGVGFSSQWYSQRFYDNTRPFSQLENALYASVHKLFYSLGIVWIVITYSTNRVVWFKRIFGWRLYEPLSRLVYCMVLIHPGLQLVMSSSVRAPQYVGLYQLLCLSAGDILASLTLSVVLYLCVEAPYRTVQKILLMPERKPRKHEEVIMEHTVSVKL